MLTSLHTVLNRTLNDNSVSKYSLNGIKMMSKANWTQVQLYFSGDDYFRDVLLSIENAQSEIWVESYIFDMDPIGIRILNALTQAQIRGVRVHILVDGVGSFNWLVSLRQYCQKHHLSLRIYHPMPFRVQYLLKISWKSLRRILFLLKRMNKRNHRKVFLIDEDHAFLGSLNVSQVHTQEFLGKRAWRDTGLKVSGPPISILKQACQQTWIKSKFAGLSFSISSPRRRAKRLEKRGSQYLRLNSNLRWRYSLLRDLNGRLKAAQKRIFITNAYFLPRRSVLRALMKASKRGIQIALCLPAVSDVLVVQWASRSLYARLLKRGIRIYEYQDRVMHAKTLIIDDWATVGSHNLNHRSLTHDLEVEVVLDQPPLLAALLQQWNKDIQSCHEITVEDLGKMRWYHRVFGRFCYWFRYWL